MSWEQDTCIVAANLVLAVPITAAIAAGVALTPEAALVVAVVGFAERMGVTITASAAATFLNTLFGGEGAVTVETVIAEICKWLGSKV